MLFRLFFSKENISRRNEKKIGEKIGNHLVSDTHRIRIPGKKEKMELEDDRCKKDILYCVMAKRNLSILVSYVREIQSFLKRTYGDRFELLPTLIGDRDQQKSCPNDVLVNVLEVVCESRRYEVIMLAFMLFLSFVEDIQDFVGLRVSHPEAYLNWLKLLSVETDNLLRGTGECPTDFLMNVTILYVVSTPLFLRSGPVVTKEITYSEHPAIEGHRE